tara:strand:+ start:437 stop:625 length:189 start_codon:yes stop_codon:yes gene_type:complete
MNPPKDVIGKLVNMEDSIGIITESNWESMVDDFVLTVVFMDDPDGEDVFTWNTLRNFVLEKK